ncbi:hypothetical protein [Stenotrophomonas sp. 24(2023)]|uniref:hypothetical protein n=1 Tax=Stenotrophomonas sp. 24(2023) TaxID=3068324 RepID=UPI0027DFE7CF|nr:hypothetical protein [Stenotrophomonas sp. 24(2023)]WMJ67576.1 hypothetical protein Q9R17_10090 [Stenotrophomonas sp. 24(2023)]
MSILIRRALATASLACVATPALAAADFAACFRLDPSVSWSVGRENTRIVATTFAEAPALAVVTSGSGMTVANLYDTTGRRRLGTVHYGIAAWGADGSKPMMTDRYDPAPTFPATATPGQRFTVTGKGTRVNHGEGSESELEYDGFSDYTFVGFQDLDTEIDYAPRTFKDTCHLTAAVEGGRVEAWYAPGFGRIKFERYSGDSLLFSDEIDSITSE